MGTRTERMRALQREVERSMSAPKRVAAPISKATETKVRRKAPWPMPAIVLRALGLAALLVAAAFTVLSVVAARSSDFDLGWAASWDIAFWSLLIGTGLCLASFIVRRTVRAQVNG